MTANAQRRWVNAYRWIITTLLGVISYFLVQIHLDVKENFKRQHDTEREFASFKAEVKAFKSETVVELKNNSRQLDRIENRLDYISRKQ